MSHDAENNGKLMNVIEIDDTELESIASGLHVKSGVQPCL